MIDSRKCDKDLKRQSKKVILLEIIALPTCRKSENLD